ncbi:tetratricopeptide repeat protein [Paenibacillus pinistramenti]|uniref:tetratricopeptide repeat protein n=1 Tax=Paenibacillus pinistramenti TaxID=1768003 RepID=UPI001107C27E|nr:tetratricopeptide repeat protein [Paenibacillus pinistramenti]
MKADDLLNKAYRCILDNDFEGAISWFEQAIAIEPERADIRYRCSITYARSDKLDQAISKAEEAIRLDPDEASYKLHFQRLQAKDLMRQAVRKLQFRQDNDFGEAAEAAVLLEQAARLDPLSAEAQVWLALSYGELKDYRKALNAIWEASALMQDDTVSAHLKKLEQRFKTYIDHTSN